MVLAIQPHRVRRLIDFVIVCLILATVIELLVYLIDVAIGATGTILIGLLALYANWMAGRAVDGNWKYYLWRLLPVCFLVGVPLVSYLTSDKVDIIDWMLFVRLVVGLVIPVAVLVYVDRWLVMMAADR